QWSERWRGRTAELAVHPITGGAPNREDQLGSSLFDAIVVAKSWRLDESRRKRLIQLCVDEYCRVAWGREHSSEPIAIQASSGGAMYPAAFRAGGYTARSMDGLKSKLQQYPAGTGLPLVPRPANPFRSFLTRPA